MMDMYADEEDQDDAPINPGVVRKGTITEVELGSGKVRIIDPDYVIGLERRVVVLERLFRQQQQLIAQTNDNNNARRQETMNLQRQLDQKLDRGNDGYPPRRY